MTRWMTPWCLILAVCLSSCSGPEQTQQTSEPSPVEMDPHTAEVVEKIDSVSAYEVPDLALKEDAKYAETTQDVKPFRHVEPYKEHFLEQMEYTGPGRAIPVTSREHRLFAGLRKRVAKAGVVDRVEGVWLVRVIFDT